MELTLFIPQLIWPEARDQDTLNGIVCPALESLLDAGQSRHEAAIPYEIGLTSLWPNPDQIGLAYLRYLGEENVVWEDNMPTHLLCADPIYLRFQQERVIVGGADTFALTAEESQALLARLNSEFADIGTFYAPHPHRWYLALHQAKPLHTPPLSEIIGRQLAPELTAGTDHVWLRRLQNEVQMVLHSHTVNQIRAERGEATLNGIWLWGAGAAPNFGLQAHPEFTDVWSNDPLAIGRAKQQHGRVYARAVSLSEVLASKPTRGLVVLDQLQQPLLYDDGAGWRSQLELLDQTWFTPLLDALSNKEITRCRLIAPQLHRTLVWDLHAPSRKSWWSWRKAQPATLAQLSVTLANQNP